MTILKNRKVVAALVGLIVALVSAGLGIEFSAQAPDAVTEVVCQVAGCV